jgi:hypothetical protein
MGHRRADARTYEWRRLRFLKSGHSRSKNVSHPYFLLSPKACMCGRDDAAAVVAGSCVYGRLLQTHCAVKVLYNSVTLTSGLFKTLAVQDFDSSSKIFN